MGIKDGVVRVQGDRLAEHLGLPPNTYFKREELDRLARAQYGDTVTVNGKTVKVTFSMKGIANIILGKT